MVLNDLMTIDLYDLDPVGYEITITVDQSGESRSVAASLTPATTVGPSTTTSALPPTTTPPPPLSPSTKGVTLGLVAGVVGVMFLAIAFILIYKRVMTTKEVVQRDKAYRGYRGISYIAPTKRDSANMFQ